MAARLADRQNAADLGLALNEAMGNLAAPWKSVRVLPNIHGACSGSQAISNYIIYFYQIIMLLILIYHLDICPTTQDSKRFSMVPP